MNNEMHQGPKLEVAGMSAMPEQVERQREVAGKIPRLSSGLTRGMGPLTGGTAAPNPPGGEVVVASPSSLKSRSRS